MAGESEGQIQSIADRLESAQDKLRTDDNEAALEAFRAIVDELSSSTQSDKGGHAHFGWGLSAFKLGRVDEALAEFRHAFEADPPHLEGGLRWADLLRGKGFFHESVAAYQSVLALVPDLSEAHFGAAEAFQALDDDDRALDHYRRAVQSPRPHAEAGFKLAELLAAKGDLQGAYKTFGALVAAFPKLADARYRLGLLAQELGREDEAIAHYRKAVYAAGSHAGGGLRLADLSLARNDIETARDAYRSVINLSPDLAEAHYGLGLCLLQSGHADAAQAEFSRALDLKPGFPAAVVANAFLSFFRAPPTNSDHPSARPVLCVPILPFVRDWLGGQIYVLNFMRSMSKLPRPHRPRLLLLVLIDDWRELPPLREVVMQCLDCDAVIGAFDRERCVLSSSPLLDRYQRLRHRAFGEADDWRAALFAKVECSFPVLYPCWGVAQLGRPLFWIPDLQHRFFPSNFSAEEVTARNNDMASLSRRDVPILFSSHDAETHFRRFFPAGRHRTYVWHFCTLPAGDNARPDPKAFADLGLPQRYYYTPNQFWLHKDHATLFRALRIILNRGHDITFVCTGSDLQSSRDPYSKELLGLIDELKLGRNLRLIGVLPRDLQLEVMRNACAVIQPSLFEGWSTVVEDARMLGRPVIASAIAVHWEQIGEGGNFFEPKDAVSLAAAVIASDATFGPGPDLVNEEAARENLEARARASAEEFLHFLAAERKASHAAVNGEGAILLGGRTSLKGVVMRLLGRFRSK
ncbi:MAG: tetratricopeptide repeat protein [Methylovirgula sp.]